MPDIKDKTLLEKIQRVKIMLAIYGVFGFFFGIYVFVYYIYYSSHSESLAVIMGLPFAFTMTLSCIFGGLKEIDVAAKLKDNILLGARDGIYGQLMITIPSAFFVFGFEDSGDMLSYVLSLLIPIIWLLFNIILFFKLRLGLLKIIAQTKQSPSSK